MHIEILVEDASGEKLLEAVLPKLLGRQENRTLGGYIPTRASAVFQEI
jgi:hypothetical protein